MNHIRIYFILMVFLLTFFIANVHAKEFSQQPNKVYIDYCGTLDKKYTEYILTDDIFAQGDCFVINSSNVILNFNGNKIIGNSLSGKGVKISEAKSVSVINGEIISFPRGVELIDSKFVTIQDVNFSFFGNPSEEIYGIYLANVSYSILRGNSIISEESIDYGVYFEESSWNLVIDNFIYWMAYRGIYLDELSSPNSFISNTFLDNDEGIVSDSPDNLFINNYFQGHDSTALYIRGDRNILKNNDFYLNNEASVFYFSDDNRVINSSFFENWNSIAIVSSYGIDFSDSNIIGSQRDAIRLVSFQGIVGRINFRNILVNNTNKNYYDLNIYGNEIEDIYFSDSLIGSYNLGSGIERLSFKNSLFGRIKFLEKVHGEGKNFDKDIIFTQNKVLINSSLNQGLDKKSEVELFNLIFSNEPSEIDIFRDGKLCIECNLIYFDGAKIEFEAPGKGIYSII